ncbi:hypothetical protein RND81_01G134200 [Saponaria officinalis]|uniref:Uncharacterized protein n=1 Tax=Saponaria officinalis TaxID=3572 RepID=A0AAW1N7J4_SAPOF
MNLFGTWIGLTATMLPLQFVVCCYVLCDDRDQTLMTDSEIKSQSLKPRYNTMVWNKVLRIILFIFFHLTDVATCLPPRLLSMDLTVSIFSTNYMKHTAGCPTLPRQMKLHFSSLDDLPCYSNPHYPCASDNDDDDDDDNDNDTDLHCSHHLNETPEFGFIETNPSTNTPSDTLQNTPEPDHVCEHQAIGRPLDEQDQCSADVRDSGDKLHCLANNVAPFGSYKFSDNIFPTLRKHVNSSSENNSDEYTRPRIEEPFQQPPHFMREQVSTIDYVLIDESPAEKHQPTGKNRLTSSTDIVSPTYTTEIEPIEIIDLYTPSPNYQNAAVSKKRRFSSSCSNFIDLTKSPVFLEQ